MMNQQQRDESLSATASHADSEDNQTENPTDNLTPRQALLHEIGEKLRQARLARSVPLDEPARKLRLRLNHLQGLEAGDWSVMPDDVYGMGFLRQYSSHLNLDLSEEIDRLKNSDYSLTKPLTFPDPPVAPSRRWAWLAAAGFVVLLLVFNFFYQESPDHRPTPLPSPTPAATEPSTPTTAASLEEDTDALIPDSSQQPQDSTPSSTDAAPQVEPITTAPPPDPLKNVRTTQPAAAIAERHLYRFEAVGEAVWIQVSLPSTSTGGKGALIKDALLQPGYHFTTSQMTDTVWITCGNAPALRIDVDGRLLASPGSLGEGKKVVRDLPVHINP